ncbi:MAG: amidohydrolase family protein [Bacteroidales bacterium]|nr:amidohydrolase family protein [Bacteroidales bacterium]
MALYLKNGTYIDWKTFEFIFANIKVEDGLDGKIEILPENYSIPKNEEIIDCSGKYITKSFANGHHHAYSALARGMPAPKKKPQNFYEILKYIWWKLDKCLDPELIEISALVTAIDCAKNGVTFVIDHHASPNAVEGSLETIAGAFDKAGLSFLLCYEISDRDGKEIALKGIEETEKYLQSRQGLVGLHASFTVGDDTLQKAVNLAEKYNSGIHIHIAEDMYDQKYSMANYNKRVINRLNDFGVLNSSKTILAHCLYLNDFERMLVRDSNAWVVQNTESNLNNKVGYFNSVGLGDNIILGTDGMHGDMLRSAKAAYFVGQNFDNVNLVSIYQRFRNIHRYISENGFSGDGENNLVIFDYDTPTEFNKDNFPGHFVFGLESKHVQHVISNGKLIVENRRMVNVDEEAVFKTSKELSKRLWSLFQRSKEILLSSARYF